MSNLFSDDEGDHDGGETMLTINEHYAKAFEYRKEREELEKLKAKYGSDYDPEGSGSDISTDSESAESEDEHGEELTPAVDAAILRTLARIRKKDPEIYNSQKNIFGEEQERLATKAPKALTGQEKSKTKAKPLTVRQNNLDAMLNPSRSPSPDIDADQPMTHVQEQEALRRETIAAFHGAITDAGDDDFLIPREKTKDEREAEEEEYRAFLEREVGDLKDLVTFEDYEEQKEDAVNVKEGGSEQEGEGEVTDKKKKKKKKKSKKASEEEATKTKREKDQEFLMNYILNRGWIDHSEGRVPTYNEVTKDSTDRRKKKGKSKAQHQDNDAEDVPEQNGDNDEGEQEGEGEERTGLLSDSSFDSVASFFETSYNHRFEEPGAATIPTFPRNLPSVVRRQDMTRKDARERRKERKEQELQKKKEEVKRLKALKMREVKRKLELIGRQGGLKTGAKGASSGDVEEEGDEFVDEALRELDLEGEWDPEKHDRQMAGLFDRAEDVFDDEGFQGGDDDDGVHFDADGKPVWDDDVDIGDIPLSDDDFEVQPQPSKKEKKKKKKKKKKDDEDMDEGGVDIDAMDADVQPSFNEEEEWDGTEEMRKRKINEYMDEVYGLDFNDMVGGMPTRFRYVPVEKQTYALSTAEILMATDQELNDYMSVKKYAPYRQDKGDRSRWKKSTQEKLHELKAKVSERTGTSFHAGSGARRSGEEEQVERVKKRKGKKERMKLKAAAAGIEENGEVDVDDQDAPKPSAKKESAKRKLDQAADESPSAKVGADPEGGDGDGDGVAKKRRKRRHKKKDTEGVTVVS